MALFQCNFFSKYLAYDTRVNVILPEDRSTLPAAEEPKKTYPVLYLLHGRGDDCNAWVRNSRIEQLAIQHQIAVVMPCAEDSFYVDSVHGKRYYSYMTKELPVLMGRWFPISSDPAHTFLAGLSMGGYGTLKLGLTEPERYAGIAFFSAATDPQQLYDLFDDPMDSEIINENLDRVFGGLPFPAQYVPIELLKARIGEGRRLPPMIFMFFMNGKAATMVFITLWSVGFGLRQSILFATFPDIFDYTEYQVGRSLAGTQYSIASFCCKLASALSSAVVAGLLVWGAYNGEAMDGMLAAGQTVVDLAGAYPSAILAIKIAFVGVSIVTNLLAFLVLVPFKLDKIYPEIRAELDKRRTAATNSEN